MIIKEFILVSDQFFIYEQNHLLSSEMLIEMNKAFYLDNSNCNLDHKKH